MTEDQMTGEPGLADWRERSAVHSRRSEERSKEPVTRCGCEQQQIHPARETSRAGACSRAGLWEAEVRQHSARSCCPCRPLSRPGLEGSEKAS